MKEEKGSELNVLIVEGMGKDSNNEVLAIRKSIIALNEKQQRSEKWQLSVSLMENQLHTFAQMDEFKFQVVIVIMDNDLSKVIFHYLRGRACGCDAKFIVLGPQAKQPEFERAWFSSENFEEVIPQFEALMRA